MAKFKQVAGENEELTATPTQETGVDKTCDDASAVQSKTVEVFNKVSTYLRDSVKLLQTIPRNNSHSTETVDFEFSWLFIDKESIMRENTSLENGLIVEGNESQSKVSPRGRRRKKARRKIQPEFVDFSNAQVVRHLNGSYDSLINTESENIFDFDNIFNDIALKNGERILKENEMNSNDTSLKRVKINDHENDESMNIPTVDQSTNLEMIVSNIKNHYNKRNANSASIISESFHKKSKRTRARSLVNCKCQFCGSSFKYKKIFLRHLKGFHGVILDDEGQFKNIETVSTEKDDSSLFKMPQPPGLCSDTEIKAVKTGSPSSSKKHRSDKDSKGSPGTKKEKASSDSSMDHMESTSEPKSILCPFCTAPFDSIISMGRHLVEAHLKSCRVNETVSHFKCPFCFMGHNSNTALQDHIIKNHSSILASNDKMNPELRSSFTCSYCSQIFQTRAKLQTHNMWHHAVKSECYRCDVCGATFPTAIKFRWHRKHHTNMTLIRPFRCSLCKRCFKTKSRAMRHIERTHGRTKDLVSLVEEFTKNDVTHQHKQNNETMIKSTSDGDSTLWQNTSAEISTDSLQLNDSEDSKLESADEDENEEWDDHRRSQQEPVVTSQDISNIESGPRVVIETDGEIPEQQLDTSDSIVKIEVDDTSLLLYTNDTNSMELDHSIDDTSNEQTTHDMLSQHNYTNESSETVGNSPIKHEKGDLNAAFMDDSKEFDSVSNISFNESNSNDAISNKTIMLSSTGSNNKSISDDNNTLNDSVIAGLSEMNCSNVHELTVTESIGSSLMETVSWQSPLKTYTEYETSEIKAEIKDLNLPVLANVRGAANWSDQEASNDSSSNVCFDNSKDQEFDSGIIDDHESSVVNIKEEKRIDDIVTLTKISGKNIIDGKSSNNDKIKMLPESFNNMQPPNILYDGVGNISHEHISQAGRVKSADSLNTQQVPYNYSNYFPSLPHGCIHQSCEWCQRNDPIHTHSPVSCFIHNHILPYPGTENSKVSAYTVTTNSNMPLYAANNSNIPPFAGNKNSNVTPYNVNQKSNVPPDAGTNLSTANPFLNNSHIHPYPHAVNSNIMRFHGNSTHTNVAQDYRNATNSRNTAVFDANHVHKVSRGSKSTACPNPYSSNVPPYNQPSNAGAIDMSKPQLQPSPSHLDNSVANSTGSPGDSKAAAHKRRRQGLAEKKHKCPYCDMAFTQTGVRKVHIRTHTGEKPYCCEQCDRRFMDRSSYQKHLRTHSGAKPYECHLCGTKFTQSGNLRRHFRTVHPGQD